MTIGEQLEEARTNRQVSLREAAEATKIRSDYLGAMEDNAMASIDLPEIYRRGFLRSYARFLKLDAERIVTDYHAQQLGRPPSSAGSTRPSFGRVDLTTPIDLEPTENTGRPRRAAEAPNAESAPRLTTPETDLNGGGATLYIKIAIVLGSVVILAGLVILLISLLRGGDDTPDLNPDLNRPATTEVLGATPEAQSVEDVTIRATATVQLIVKDTATGATLFSGTLEGGESTPALPLLSPLDLRFTMGSAIEIVRGDGRIERPGTSGVGRTRID